MGDRAVSIHVPQKKTIGISCCEGLFDGKSNIRWNYSLVFLTGGIRVSASPDGEKAISGVMLEGEVCVERWEFRRYMHIACVRKKVASRIKAINHKHYVQYLDLEDH